MRITKYTHACVRLEDGGRALLIDPGVWTEDEALAGVDAILVTHEHADHIDAERLAGLGVPVYAPADAAITGVELTGVNSGDEFAAAGFAVRAVGGRHAFIHGGKPDCANLGYVVDGDVYHPGDALHVPEQPVETLLVPVHGPWLKMTEAIDFVRAISPRRTFAIHDAALNDRGLGSVNAWLTGETDGGYRYVAAGEAV